mmetsp:Transcript_149945/g.417827  ORF Transcript_149945/g.417827 Transcript_149945/m.417827 type:complete len:96 (+) Transcript_149945:81-368(+)
MKACVAYALVALVMVAGMPSVAARRGAGAAPATTMAGVEGEAACSADEYERYKTIVCKIESACGCADTTCELDWCSEYVHNWKKEFGACTLKGCQ